MTFYHIEFAKARLDISGGETWMISLVKELSKKGYHNVLLTTDNGKQTYEKLGLREGVNVEYKIIHSYKSEKRYPMFVSYLTRTYQALKLIRNFPVERDGYVVCHSDFFPNTVPFLFLAKKVMPRHRVSLIHVVCPALFKGFEHHYTGGFSIPSLQFIHHKLNQFLCFKIINRRKSVVITNNSFNVKPLEKKCPKRKIVYLKHFAATNVSTFKEPKTINSDIIWVGRFQKLKGLLDLPDIIKTVAESIPDINVTVIGGGNDGLKRTFLRKVKQLGIEKNIKLAGAITGSQKDKMIRGARLFANTSHYENCSIVILESMLLDTPMVAYDMPGHYSYSGGLEFVPMFDKNEFAKKIIMLLNDKTAYSTLQKKMRAKVQEFSWDKTAYEFLLAIGETKGLKKQ